MLTVVSSLCINVPLLGGLLPCSASSQFYNLGMIMKKTALVIGMLALLLQGCATPHVMQTKQVSDVNLSCTQILSEISEADKFEAEARAERGVTGKNVVVGLLFWPALIGTYSNTDEAIKAAKERRANMTNLYEQKKCK